MIRDMEFGDANNLTKKAEKIQTRKIKLPTPDRSSSGGSFRGGNTQKNWLQTNRTKSGITSRQTWGMGTIDASGSVRVQSTPGTSNSYFERFSIRTIFPL